MRRMRSQRGTALVEAAVTIPILLLIAVGLFEFGRAFQTWQVLTNAAREGARLATLPNTPTSAVTSRVDSYMQSGQIPSCGSNCIYVNRASSLTVNGQQVPASTVTVSYPYTFMVLKPVAKLVNPGTTTGNALTMTVTAVMRNEQ